MFWRLPALSASSPVESILDKENFTLEELLDEEEIIQECKALNSRLINFLRDRAQVEQLLRYIVEEPPEDAESKQAFKFPFIACEIFTCEIDVIFKTLVEDDELMNMLFSFLEPNRPHSALLAGYFSKVVVCLMLRKTVPLMNYVQAHQDIFRQLVDLIGITSIMEVLVRLVGADDHMYPNFMDVMKWLADSNLLEMIVDKLNPSSPPEVHANAAETLCVITRNSPSALAAKISSPSFVERILSHALEISPSKSTLVHSLSVCISLLDPKRSASIPFIHSIRSQHLYEPPIPLNPETVSAMLPKLGDLLMLLSVSSDDNILPTTYGELRPPLGKHRLKIVEFIAVLLRTGNEDAEKELVSSGAIQRILDLFFEYPFNNSLHHHVESIIVSCLESKNGTIIDHLFRDCNLIGKILKADRHSILSGDSNLPTVPAAGRQSPRTGNLGHNTRIANKLVQLGDGNDHIHAYLQENGEWIDWQTSVLQERNTVENVYRWACGRPTALQERTRDSDEDELQDRDYDVAALANNLSQAFRYNMYENEETEEVHGSLERDDEDVYFDDESAEVVISSLRVGDDQESSLFTNSNWFAFQDDRTANESLSTSLSERMDEISLGGTMTVANGGSGSDDEVVVGVDEELVESATSGASGSTENGHKNGSGLNPDNEHSLGLLEKASISNDLGFFRFETADNDDLFGDRPLPEWVGWRESSDFQVGGSVGNPFTDNVGPDSDPSRLQQASGPIAENTPCNGKVDVPNGLASVSDSSDGPVETDMSRRIVPSLFEEDVEFVGVELEGTEKAMDQALKEGIVGEAGPLKRSQFVKSPEKGKSSGDDAEVVEFNDKNYWRVEQEVGIVQE
ncbi:uncharacterized protein LOC131245949 isoform X1 [Magnolia sinica]|uniref:uncharacterized protein LOC131245949 isoform X1 n=2 Tax=Magnolia sinica TaxID=86752 RepID=UPI00265AC560|nr:uncharacterized protein LOC131245949 isoform X1 [Magnolia sinica]